MNKEQFLQALKVELLPYVNYSELENILNYYNDFIDEGCESKSEEEVILEFGDLHEFASKLLESFKENNIELDGQEPSDYFLVETNIKNIPIVLKHGSYTEINAEIPPEIENWFNVIYSSDSLIIHQIDCKMNMNIKPIVVYIPNTLNLVEKITTENASISIEGNNTTVEGEYTSKNGKLTASNLLGNSKFKTSNGKINIEDCHGSILQCKSSNGAISMEDSSYKIAILDTSNAKITVEDSRIDSLTIDTSNGNIHVEDSIFNTLEATTTNAAIHIEGCNPECEITYSTSNSKVKLFDQNYPTKGKYQSNLILATLKLMTTNAKIIVEN